MRALWLLPALALTLSACSGAPRDELRADVEAVTLAANDGSAEGVREAVDELLSTIRAQVAGGDLDRTKAERLRTLALRIAENAAALEPAPPSPPPTLEPEPEPTKQPEPEPEPTKEPEPEPTKEPKPKPTKEPEPEPEPTLEVVVPPPAEESPPPQSRGGGGGRGGGAASPGPSPAA